MSSGSTGEELRRLVWQVLFAAAFLSKFPIYYN